MGFSCNTDLAAALFTESVNFPSLCWVFSRTKGSWHWQRLLSPWELALPTLSQVHPMSHMFLYSALTSWPQWGKDPILCTQLCSSGCSEAPGLILGCQACDAVQVCAFGEGCRSWAGPEGELATLLHALWMKQWQNLPQRPRQPARRHSLGQKSSAQPGADKTASRLFVDQCPPLPHRHMLGDKKQAASLQVLTQPPAL